ncbi:11915_t:CDS:2 [Funneliformis caledonium]|uniref:11915_t:CDS:1 n=1 Tax=Funneliformis caledonium TaxID=1117310 RepID=A0A9N9E888_9GLOM|nr:11915_t:CDS:2 [Funneliformis caledonium]
MMEYVFVDDLHRYKRLKVTRACESCRRRKVKCDGGSGGSQTPCSSCRKLKIDCIFSNMAMKRTAPKTEQEQMDERLQRSENLLNKLDEEEKQVRKVSVDYVDTLTDVLGHMKIDYSGRANYIYSMEGRMLKDGEEVPPEMLILVEPPLPYHQFPSNGCNPSPELINHSINLYFIHVHPYVPILHKSDFLRRLNDKSNPISPLLLYSVLAMGAKFSDDVNVRLDPMKPETAGYAYYNHAKDLLDDFLDTPRLSTIQAQILMLKFQEGIRRPGFFFRSWLYFGVIIRMAQDLGLNKNYEKWNLQISRGDAVVRKRVWQICFLCDQFMSGAQGREVVISLSNTDIELPRKEDYEDEQELQIQTDFVHFVRLAKILANVMSVIAPSGSGAVLQSWTANPKLQILDDVLDAWLQALPSRLRCHPSMENNSNSLPHLPTSHFAGFLNVLYHTIVILLHRPYITSIESGKVPQSNPQHLNMCTTSANSISQIAQTMFEHWGPMVFQYPIRGGNYGVYCLVAASMIHLVNMSSPEMRVSRLAHDHLLRTLGVLKVCVEHSAAWDLRDRVNNLEAAFSAQQARQSAVAMLFHPGSQPNSPNLMSHMAGRPRRPIVRRRATTQNTTELRPAETNQPIFQNSLPNNFSNYPQNTSPPHFHERSLYILPEDHQSEQHSFPPEHERSASLDQFDFIPAQPSMEENSLLTNSLGQMPITPSGLSAPMTVPTSGTFNPLLQMQNSKQFDIDSNGSFWDTNSLLLWNNQFPNTTAQMWTQNGGISPLSISTSPSADSPSGHQSPDHGSPASIEQYSQSNAGSPANSVVDPVIVASQNSDDLILGTENVWFS